MSDVTKALQSVDAVIRRGPFAPTWESILAGYRVPQWYREGKFGIFIHWGLYSVPAFGNEWYPRNMYQRGSKEFEHHLATYGPHVKFGYKDFIPELTAAEYHPGEWAQLFKRAGARFVIPVAEHHDGFPMYDCSFTEWTAFKMGPKRDLVGELAPAVRAEGMTFGLSNHRAENVWFYDVQQDGFSLDDKRDPTPDKDDLPDVRVRWKGRTRSRIRTGRRRRSSCRRRTSSGRIMICR